MLANMGPYAGCKGPLVPPGGVGWASACRVAPMGPRGGPMGPKNRIFCHLGLFPRYFGYTPTKAGPLAGRKGPLVPPSLVRVTAAHTGVPLRLMGVGKD